MLLEHSHGQHDQRPLTFKCIDLRPVELFEFVDSRNSRSGAVALPGRLFLRGHNSASYGANKDKHVRPFHPSRIRQ